LRVRPSLRRNSRRQSPRAWESRDCQCAESRNDTIGIFILSQLLSCRRDVDLIAQDKGAPWVRPRVDARTSLRQGDQKQKAPPKVASSFVPEDYNFLTESGAGTGMREQQRSSA